MRLFFVNTDAVSYDSKSAHDEWFRRGIILTGGAASYKNKIDRIPAGAYVLVYVKSIGVVGVAKVMSDQTDVVLSPATVYITNEPEYHRKVAWLLDLRSSPITWAELQSLVGQGPLSSVQEVHQGKDALWGRVEELMAQPTSDRSTYLRSSATLLRRGLVARPAGHIQPKQVSTVSAEYIRDPKVRAWTLQRAQGRCELCGHSAPFVDDYSEPYLESHHITPLANGGPDTPGNTAALCPDCHRELHLGLERVTKTELLRSLITVKDAKNH
ncbi:MAG TPA: HNH endonuclease [Rubrivivax sp.]|nr:HNH endonuclease [Rubrivivax sp.]